MKLFVRICYRYYQRLLQNHLRIPLNFEVVMMGGGQEVKSVELHKTKKKKEETMWKAVSYQNGQW